MFLSNASIKRPVAMSALIIALVLLGVNSYRKLGVDNFPRVEFPYITIVTVYPGASPEEIETDIARKIEDAVVAIDGLKHVSSACMENVSQTLLEFHLHVDVDTAANDVREKLDMILAELPADAESPKVLKFDVNAKPILNLALTGELSIEELYDYADDILRDRISVLPGVAEVQLLGGSKREVHVLLDRHKMAARGLLSTHVVQALGEGITRIPSGRIRESGSEYTVKFDAEYADLRQIENLQIAGQDGARCYLKDLGTITFASEELRSASFLNGQPAIGIRVVKKADANAVRVVQQVREVFERLQAELPGGMQLNWVSDDGDFIQASVDSAWSNIFQGVLLTAAILFLFLYNVRSTLIVAVTMPLTIVISFVVMQYLDYTLNISTLLAIGISVGILVTNSIVVLESIVSHLAKGRLAPESARMGSADVAVAVVASAGTNLVVLIPVAMMGGMIGLFIRPFALMMAVVTLISLFISFTLTPILCAALMKSSTGSERRTLIQRMEATWNRFFSILEKGYGVILHWLAKRKWASILLLAGAVGLLVHAVSLLPDIGMGFFQNFDQGQIFLKLEYPTRYNLQNTISRVQEVEEKLQSLPGLKNTFTTIGKVEGVVGQSSEGVYLAQVLLNLVPKTERQETMEELLDEVRRRLEDYPECIVSVSVPAAVGGQSLPIMLEIAGEDLEVLDQYAERIARLALEVDGVLEPDNSVREGKPELRIQPNRAILADLELPAVGLGMTLRGNLEGLKAASFKEGARTYDIRVKFDEEEGKDQIHRFLLPGAPGNPVLLTTMAQVEESLTPIQISRKDKRRVSMVYANLYERKPLGTAVNEIEDKILREAALPAGYDYRFVGQYEVMQEAVLEFLEAGLLAILMTYLVLAAILESFKQPFIILLTIPLGFIGMLYALYVTGESLGMFPLLGGVMLIGIVVNNAILILDQVNVLKNQGIPAREAMLRAAVGKLRPILMITMAAVLGMLPLALGSGLGSENRNGMGITSIGGILISAVLTLLIIPVLFDLFTRELPAKPRPHDA